MTRHWVWAARRPFYLLQGASRELLEWYWRREELNNLKTLLRALHLQSPSEQFLPALIPLEGATELPWHALAAAPSVAELVERLRATWYGKVLQPVLEQYRRRQSVFVLEVALDLAYYRRLRGLVTQLHGRDRQEADQALSFWIDAQNLLWAYRYRLYAQLSPEEILNYTLQRNLRVNAKVVRAIALGAPLLETVQRVWPNQLPDLESLATVPERDALPRLELILWRHLYHWAKQTRATAALHLGAVLAYEILLESEVRDLVTLVEGKVFHRTGDQLRPYLIRVGQWDSETVR
ncbi:MAG: V-type ATPase subunit [Caldilineaceae bacterium]